MTKLARATKHQVGLALATKRVRILVEEQVVFLSNVHGALPTAKVMYRHDLQVSTAHARGFLR